MCLAKWARCCCCHSNGTNQVGVGYIWHDVSAVLDGERFGSGCSDWEDVIRHSVFLTNNLITDSSFLLCRCWWIQLFCRSVDVIAMAEASSSNIGGSHTGWVTFNDEPLHTGMWLVGRYMLKRLQHKLVLIYDYKLTCEWMSECKQVSSPCLKILWKFNISSCLGLHKCLIVNHSHSISVLCRPMGSLSLAVSFLLSKE